MSISWFFRPKAVGAPGWIWLLAMMALGLAGCELINPDEQVPAYLRIERFQFTPGVAGGATTSHISDAWVYVDNELLGAFELPATVPVLREGQVKVILKPGIYADAQKGLRFTYPFYTEFSATAVLTAGQTTRVLPTTSYDAAVVHPFDEVKEDFETTNSVDAAFELTSAGHYELLSNVRADPPGLSLQIPASFGGVGLVQGKAASDTVFFLDSKFYGLLPQRGAPVYAELDYRSSMPFQVGVAWSTNPTPSGAIFTRTSELTVFPKEEWTKLYVNLTAEVSTVNNLAARFRLYIKGLPTGEAGQYLALDNIRLVRKN